VWVSLEPTPRVCSRSLIAPIWNGATPTQPLITASLPEAKCSSLSSEVAAVVSEAWVVMLRGVRYPPPSNVIGLDGTTYHFSALDAGERLAGQIWSPKASTPTARLVAVVEALRAYSVSSTTQGAMALCRLALAVNPEGRRLTGRCT